MTLSAYLTYDETVRKIKDVFLFFLVLLCLQKAPIVFAASSLSLSPSNGNQTLSTPFSVDVKIDTGGEAAKTIKAYLSFPSALLVVDDILTTGTVITSWNERLYSNNNGTINLVGDISGAGLNGANKLLATIKFRPKANGLAAVKFTTSSQVVRLADSSDILSLTASAGGKYAIGENLASPTATPSATLVPKTGDRAGAISVLLISIFLTTLGVSIGRSISRNSET